MLRRAIAIWIAGLGTAACSTTDSVWVDCSVPMDERAFKVCVVALTQLEWDTVQRGNLSAVLDIVSGGKLAREYEAQHALWQIEMRRDRGQWISVPSCVRVPQSMKTKRPYLVVVSNFGTDTDAEMVRAHTTLGEPSSYRFSISGDPPRLAFVSPKGGP